MGKIQLIQRKTSVKLQHTFNQKICMQEENKMKYFKCLKRKTTNPHTVKLYFKGQGEIKTLSDKQNEGIHYQQA